MLEKSNQLAREISHGEQRQLELAIALAAAPRVLLLDEPAAGLGDAETAELAHLVGRLAKEWGIAVLLVEHDMNFVMSVCDELVVLDFGRQIAAGERPRTAKFWRATNEIPFLVAVIVVLAVTLEFWSR